MNRVYVTADIHGNVRALRQCIERSGIDRDNDILIVLGDTVDGWPFVKQTIDELLTFKKLIHIIGNHDLWAIKYWVDESYRFGEDPNIWLSQGGNQTKLSYGYELPPKEHIKLLQESPLYLETVNGNVYVHGGIDPNQRDLSKQTRDTITWDRQLMESAWNKHFCNPNYKFAGKNRIFIGHTTTEVYGDTKPLFLCNVVCMDTGAGWSGKLTFMDVNTLEYWQSDLAKDLYPEMEGRK